MGHRSLVLAIAAIASICATSANAQSVYVAPGGVYIGGGPVYVTPAPAPYAAPTYGPPYAAPTYGYGYGPPAPAIVAPAPAIVAPTAAYEAPVYAYGAELPPRPPAPVPYVGMARCAYGYWPSC
jgi:hypothetical protein